MILPHIVQEQHKVSYGQKEGKMINGGISDGLVRNPSLDLV